MTGTVEISGGVLRRTDPEPWPEVAGVGVEQPAPGSFVLRRLAPGTREVYYRLAPGRLEWSTEWEALLDGPPPAPDPGDLLALIHGVVPAPEATPLPGVQRLTVGTSVHAGPDGVRVTRARPAPGLPRSGGGLRQAVAEFLRAQEPYAVAYSGGLASAFVAVGALDAGHRPPLLHAELDVSTALFRPPRVPGLPVRNVPVRIAALLDHEKITGAEPVPPLPDTEARRRLFARLREAGGLPVVSGGFLKDLTSAELHEVDLGWRGLRLLGCEPFHITGTLTGLTEARQLLGEKVVFAPGLGGREIPDEQPVGTPPPPRPTSAVPLPVLTDAGEEALLSAMQGSIALWKEHLELVGAPAGHLVAGLAERGDGDAVLPALHPAVLGAASALRPADRAAVRRGMFRNHLPLETAVARRGVRGPHRAATGHWLRIAAADHLLRQRRRLASWFAEDCALADLDLIEPRALRRLLADGRALADHALPVIRLIWVEQWLRGRR